MRYTAGTGQGAFPAYQCHLKILSPTEKKMMPMAVRMPAGSTMPEIPAPSMKTLRMPSVSMVSGRIRIRGMLQSGKSW